MYRLVTMSVHVCADSVLGHTGLLASYTMHLLANLIICNIDLLFIIKLYSYHEIIMTAAIIHQACHESLGKIKMI